MAEPGKTQDEVIHQQTCSVWEAAFFQKWRGFWDGELEWERGQRVPVRGEGTARGDEVSTSVFLEGQFLQFEGEAVFSRKWVKLGYDSWSCPFWCLLILCKDYSDCWSLCRGSSLGHLTLYRLPDVRYEWANNPREPGSPFPINFPPKTGSWCALIHLFKVNQGSLHLLVPRNSSSTLFTEDYGILRVQDSHIRIFIACSFKKLKLKESISLFFPPI